MEDKIFNEHTAGSQSIGFDYQFYYFIYLLLGLKQGEKIGYEVKDDIHIEKADGKIVLMQAKHTIQTNSDGDVKNMTSLDIDMWKTLNIWVEVIKKSSIDELKKYSFVLVTNKNNNGKNKLMSIIISCQQHNSTIDSVLDRLKELSDETTDKTIKEYIKNIKSIPKKKFLMFLNAISFKTGNDNIIEKIKSRLKGRLIQTDDSVINSIFESLLSNISVSKYIDIKQGLSFELTFEDFSSKFGKCFKVAFENKPLPKRKFDYIPPEDIEQQIFIKQLKDIGDIDSNSTDMIDYATQMYQAINQFQFWTENNYVLPTEMNEFEKNAICTWKNEFKAKYRTIQNKINNGTTLESLEDNIKNLALELVDFIRRQKLVIQNYDLGVEESNGYFYVLSDEPKIGWHFNWEEKYKKK